MEPSIWELWPIMLWALGVGAAVTFGAYKLSGAIQNDQEEQRASLRLEREKRDN